MAAVPAVILTFLQLGPIACCVRDWLFVQCEYADGECC